MSESRETELIKAIIDNLDDSETEYTKTPQSRNEEILVSILNETEYTKTPQSREEELLLELKEKIGGLVPPVPPVIKRVTGNPVEFTDGADAPLVKCVTQITGSQDLHGYDKPWVGGAGKNKLPLSFNIIKTYTTGTWVGNTYYYNGITFTIYTDEGGDNVTAIKATGTATSSAFFMLYKNLYLDSDSIINGCPFDGGDNSYFLDAFTTRSYRDSGAGRSIPGNTNYIEIYIGIRSGYSIPEGGLLFYPMIRLATVTDPTFAPYSNICPITAYTEGEIEVSDGDGNTTTHTTTYPSAIYRGSEDVVNGEVVTEWGMIASYAGETLPGEWISDRDEYAPGTTPTTGAQVAYALATPTTSSVTPTNLPIKSLSGYNHIESSTGDMTIDYITDAYQNFVDTVESALPNTRKSGTKAMDIFLSLDNPKIPDQKEVDEIQNGVKEEIVDDRR